MTHHLLCDGQILHFGACGVNHIIRNKSLIIYVTKVTNSDTPRPPQTNAAGAPELEITPPMVRAGVEVAREHYLGASLEDLVVAVFVAMWLEGCHTSSSASATRSFK